MTSSTFMLWRHLLVCLLLQANQLFAQVQQSPAYSSQTPRYNPTVQQTSRYTNPQTQYQNPLLNNQQSTVIGGGSLDPNQNGGNSNFYQYRYTPFGGSNLNNLNLDGVDENNFCPEYWMAYRSSCYRFIKSPKRSWDEARKICVAYQADLINIDTPEKHNFILQQLILQNQQQNRYFVSARQTSPTNWVNEDGTPVVRLEGIFSYDEQNEFDEDELRNNNFFQDHQNFRPNQQNPYNNAYNPYNNEQNQNRQQQGFSLNDQYDRLLQKNRVVYGFSRSKNRWLLIPTYSFEHNLFICESALLWNAKNINILADSLRKYDYGFEVVDIEKVPRGPYFIRQPKDTIFDTSRINIRNDITIQCLAGGYPTPTYSWFKEEYINDNLTFIQIDPLKNARYTISGGNLIILKPEQTLDQGTYHCIASNKFGRILSESVDLNFGFIMEFNLKRSPETGELNWGKSVYCDPPQHYPDVKYYWSRGFFPNFVDEDQRLFVSHDGALYFSALEQNDRANYSCTVYSTASDTGRSGPFFQLRAKASSNYQEVLFANSFPKIFPEAAKAGQDIRLECMAFGYPVPSYNWTRKDGALPRNSHLESWNRVLVIKNASINDNGEYLCTVKNDRKAITKGINLNIQMDPVFTIPLRDQIKDFSSEVNFVCEAFAIPDVNYTWYKNAEQLHIEEVDRDKFIIQDNILTIKYLDPDKDDGMYQCRAQNQLRGVYSSAQLRVLSMKPSFKKRPLESEIYAINNGNTTILCDPEAAPRPNFTWRKDGNVIGAGGHRRITPQGTLIISPTSRDDEGVYTCVATNSYGSDESNSRVIVLQELRFTQTLRPRIIMHIGEYLNLHCQVVYDDVLDVAFIWTHNGQQILEEYDQRIIIDYNILEIRNISVLDTGDYECIAKSAVNYISSRTTLTVQGPPGAPGGVKVRDIKKGSAIVEWIDGTDNGRPIIYYNVLGRTNWNKTWVNVTEGVRAHEFDRYTGRKQAEIINLTPWSAYEFSVCAVNDLGIGTPSAPSPSKMTYSDKPYISPRNVDGGGGKIGDLSIKWDALKSQEQNGPGIYYKVFWRLHAVDREWAHKVIRPPHGENVDGAVVQVPVGNYYLQYDVKVQAFNEIGHGPESPVSVVYSAEDMPQVAPQQPVAQGYNSTSLNMTWLPVDPRRDNMRGKLIGHRLKYWKKDFKEEDSIYYLSRTTRNWALIVGLEPDTYYFVKVMAFNSAGEGPESERYLERTYKKAPQKPPSAVHVEGINPSTVRVVWRYVSAAYDEEPLQGYKVRVWESDQDMSTANDSYIPIGRKLECYVTTLTPGKSYKLRVLAYSNGGDGRMSSPTHHFQMGDTDAINFATSDRRIDRTLFTGLLILYYLFKMVQF